MSDDLLDLLKELFDNGWDADFHVRPGGLVMCSQCRASIAAEAMRTARFHRVEHDTDPEAQSLVVEATCPQCGSRGTLVCGYGAAASDDDAAVLASLPQ